MFSKVSLVQGAGKRGGEGGGGGGGGGGRGGGEGKVGGREVKEEEISMWMDSQTAMLKCVLEQTSDFI